MFIAAAIGVNSYTEENLKKIILAGADAIRYSFTYGTLRKNIDHLKTGLKVIDELNSSAKIMANLPSNKIRIGGLIKPVIVKENDEIVLQSASSIKKDNKEVPIPVETDELAKKVYVNQITTIDHGKIAIQITEIINNDTIKAKVLNEGTLRATHTINITQDIESDDYIKRCAAILKALEEVAPRYLIIPYVNNVINEKIKSLSDFKWKHRIIVRIEDQAGVDQLEAICKDQFYDGVLINRGELGETTPFEKLGIMQKEIIKTIKKHKKQAMVSSQILEGSIQNFIPLRSDILDLTNIIIDGADGIVLTHETALSTRPAYTLSVAKKIIMEAEKYRKIQLLND